ncbi:hypothetical protein ACFFQF_31595 [Haladaptatus pallidirubidus]|uniref:Amphi-Trp domain-containing protein n=1 Tax=Haladaptatus pallidirubidus TaxID=1008152 RepID=A0AAV3UPP7_9EURY|nr:hypothetical protein [Haladaptatus pallidirubidus]
MSNEDADEVVSEDLEIDEEDDHVLPSEDLLYPEFTFEEGDVGDRGEFDLSRSISREEMIQWLDDISGGLTSHDIAVESPGGHVRFGVSPKDVEMQFSPDDDFRGDLEITFRLNAKAMFVADDPTKQKVGARGRRGFIPIQMLTSEKEIFRCYNWIDDPSDP